MVVEERMFSLPIFSTRAIVYNCGSFIFDFHFPISTYRGNIFYQSLSIMYLYDSFEIQIRKFREYLLEENKKNGLKF